MNTASSPSQQVPARDRLLAAAVEAFGELGYAATTTRDIAARAGMSPAAVYVHHAAKEDLLFTVSREGHERALEIMQAAAASSSVPLEQLRRMTHDFTAWHAENSRVARVVQLEMDSLSSEHRHEVAGFRHEIVNTLIAVLKAGTNDGSMDITDLHGTALAILSLSIDLIRWYRPGHSEPAEQLATLHGNLATRMVTP